MRSGNGYFSLTTSGYDDEHPHLAPLPKPPVELRRRWSSLNLLADVFSRSQYITDKEFTAKLERGGIEYTVKHIESATYITVGRFGYRFNEQGKSRGGWVRNYSEDRTSDWEQWAALLNERT